MMPKQPIGADGPINRQKSGWQKGESAIILPREETELDRMIEQALAQRDEKIITGDKKG